jgi:hypothetical protein
MAIATSSSSRTLDRVFGDKVANKDKLRDCGTKDKPERVRHIRIKCLERRRTKTPAIHTMLGVF